MSYKLPDPIASQYWISPFLEHYIAQGFILFKTDAQSSLFKTFSALIFPWNCTSLEQCPSHYTSFSFSTIKHLAIPAMLPGFSRPAFIRRRILIQETQSIYVYTYIPRWFWVFFILKNIQIQLQGRLSNCNNNCSKGEPITSISFLKRLETFATGHLKWSGYESLRLKLLTRWALKMFWNFVLMPAIGENACIGL